MYVCMCECVHVWVYVWACMCVCVCGCMCKCNTTSGSLNHLACSLFSYYMWPAVTWDSCTHTFRLSCQTAYRTGSPTHSEFTRIISTACDRNQVAYCSHSKTHNFAQESRIEKIKVPLWSAINVFSGDVLISVSTKCGKWLVYGETVTYAFLLRSEILMGSKYGLHLCAHSLITTFRWPLRATEVITIKLTLLFSQCANFNTLH